MGLLKRILSFGSKKNKKQRPAAPEDIPDVPALPAPHRPDRPSISPLDELEHEAAVGRLLRSSSTRFVENREVNNASLPPLPHPINDVIQPPAVSTLSLSSSTIGHVSTYNVTVHQRRRHASTEVPTIDRGTEDKKSKRNSKLTPNGNEDSRILRLRSDPSVASLISLYDEHGKLAADAFSNSPPSSSKVPVKEERAQCKRSGSTLRQLLGAPTYNDRDEDNSEGDISWAERFLGEIGDQESDFSSSTPMIQTPVSDFIPPHAAVDLSFASDMSVLEPDNPAISSMEVELSLTDDQPQDFVQAPKNSPYRVPDPATPQRASQVFDFLTRGKQSKAPLETDLDLDRPLPEPPSTFSSPSDAHGSEDDKHHAFDFSADFVPSRPPPSPARSDIGATPQPRRIAPLSYSAKEDVASPQLHSCFSDDSHDVHPMRHRASTATVQATPAPAPAATQTEREVHVLMTGPTKVILTTATPMNDEPGRLRGPRALPRRRSKENQRRRSAFAEMSNGHPKDPVRMVKHQDQRRSSGSSQRSTASRHSYDGSVDYGTRKVSGSSSHRKAQKENQLGLSVRTELPSTPLRTNTSGSQKQAGNKALLKSVVQHSLAQSNTSSEMSSVGRQIMADVRQQRINVRERERDRTARRLERV